MYLKRKRCGKYKARGCADGRKQRAWTNKEDASSPTISTEAVFLTSIIDALENRDVAIVDVPGAFMQADMDELVHVRFTGTMVDLLIKIDAEMYELVDQVIEMSDDEFGKETPMNKSRGKVHDYLGMILDFS